MFTLRLCAAYFCFLNCSHFQHIVVIKNMSQYKKHLDVPQHRPRCVYTLIISSFSGRVDVVLCRESLCRLRLIRSPPRVRVHWRPAALSTYWCADVWEISGSCARVKSLSWRQIVWVQSVIGAIDSSQSSTVNTDGSIISAPRPERSF